MSQSDAPAKPALSILLASPRGYCAGVERAIAIVEQALLRYGPPVYVRHEIVHNRAVVEALEAKGAVFVDELSQIPHGPNPYTMPVIRWTRHTIEAKSPVEVRLGVSAVARRSTHPIDLRGLDRNLIFVEHDADERPADALAFHRYVQFQRVSSWRETEAPARFVFVPFFYEKKIDRSVER